MVPSRLVRIAIALLVLLSAELAFVENAVAQQDSVRANPNAVKLNRIWTMQGSHDGPREVGMSVGSLGDINGDSLMDFGVVRIGSTDVFLGGRPVPSNVPYQTIANSVARISSNFEPSVGDHWGTGHGAIGLTQGFDLVVFRTDSGRIADSPSARWQRYLPNDVRRAIGDVKAADIDHDEYDELIVGQWGGGSGDSTDYRAQILIYRGGPDFALDMPEYVIRDTEANEGGHSYAISVGDFDGDGHADIAQLVRYYTVGAKLKIYFGDGTIEGFGPLPDRIAFVGGTFQMHVTDVDGDRISDIFITDGYLFRSGTGKNARERSFTFEDADQRLLGDGQTVWDLGPLNDSTRRYSMVAKNRGAMHAYSGGPTGPDRAYDAYYYPTLDGFIENVWDARCRPLGDVNGDGWFDVLCGHPYYSFSRYGIALVLSGGAYIPRDSFPPSAIRDVTLGGRIDAFTLWPMPATSELNVAWRGDLLSMPRSYSMVDLLGRTVASGDIGFGASHVQLSTLDLAPGQYVITFFDRSRHILVSERVLKR